MCRRFTLFDSNVAVFNHLAPLLRFFRQMISKHLQWNELSRLSLIGSVALEQLKSVPELSTLPEPKVHIWNMMSLLAMVESGNGVTILATLTIPPSYSDRITFVPITGPILPREVGILRLAQRSVSLPCSQMISMIHEHVRNQMSDFAARHDNTA